MPVDPRVVANIIIDEAKLRRRPVTHLSLQKILYFVQGRFLSEQGEPLISGFFEAWQYGPVHPMIYDTFKSLGAAPILDPALKRDLLTGQRTPIDINLDDETRQWIRDVASGYIKLTPGRLVDLSHAKGSPWDTLTAALNGSRSYGQRITNELIQERFRHHKVSIGTESRIGEPNEESPPH